MGNSIQISSFNFLGSRITHLDFDSSIFRFEDRVFTKKIGYKIEIKEVGNDGDHHHYGEVVLTIEVDLEGKDNAQGNNATIHLAIEGGFHAPDEMDIEEFKKMLQINGAAALYSIARSYLISVTSQSFVYGDIVLPLVNFFPNSASEEETKEKS